MTHICNNLVSHYIKKTENYLSINIPRTKKNIGKNCKSYKFNT